MGYVYVDAVVRGTKAERTVRFLVDTGAGFTVIPRALARELGMHVLPVKYDVTLANGGTVRAVEAGTLGIALSGREAPMTTLVLPEDNDEVEPLLGVEALEGLGLRVDPTSGKIEATRARAVLLVGARPKHRRGRRG